VILVDDGSTGDSVSIIKEIVGNDLRFKFFENAENRGCGYAKAKCADLANGELLGFVDPDDAIVPNAIEIMVAAHNLNMDAAIITSCFAFVDMQMQNVKKGPYSCEIPRNKSYLTYGKGALSHFATFKNARYQETEGINPAMKRAVDQDLYYKMEEVGEHVFLDQVLYNYRVNKNSISANNNVYKAEYWHLIAKVNAFKRRKKNNDKIKNFTKREIKILQSNYYLNRFERLKFQPKKTVKLNLLLQSIYKGGTHRLVFKLKSILLVISGKI
jgi:glycosyltransferase involved in cell wall biosynthesis